MGAMESFTWAKAKTSDAGEAKVAVLLPGSGYPVQGPVLFWVGEMLTAFGWHVQAVRWTPEDEPGPDPHAFVARAAEEAFAAVPLTSRRLVVAKSFGTLAIPWAEDTKTAGVWLTPLLTDAKVRETIAHTDKADLFIGGSEDKLWDGGQKSESVGTFVEIPGADHSLQIPNDWRASQELQSGVFSRIEEFVKALPDAVQ